MKPFKDNEGRTWSVSVTVSAIKRVRDLLGVDLLKVTEGTLLQELAGDPVLLVDVVFALCKPEADKRGISDVEFGEAMAGDAIDAATVAVLEDLVDFFRSGPRARLRKALAKMEKIEAMALARADRVLDSDQLERRVEASLDAMDRTMETNLSTLGGSSGSTPASSDSTPGP